MPITETSNISTNEQRRRLEYFSDEHGEIELGTPYS
jgi:hypothetical protein